MEMASLDFDEVPGWRRDLKIQLLGETSEQRQPVVLDVGHLQVVGDELAAVGGDFFGDFREIFREQN